MFCKNCGAQMNDNQKFCPNCGTPVQQSETVQTQGNSGQSAGNYAYQQGPAGGYPQGTGQSPKYSAALTAPGKPVLPTQTRLTVW